VALEVAGDADVAGDDGAAARYGERQHVDVAAAGEPDCAGVLGVVACVAQLQHQAVGQVLVDQEAHYAARKLSAPTTLAA
jgi:hypothetical protein